MIDLNVTGDNWNRNQRNGINENWQRIKNGLSNLQGQIKILAGGEEVDELLKRLNDAVESATVAVQESIDANNTATQDAITANNQALQIALNTIGAALTDVGNAIQAAETATNDAMEAKDAALQAAGDAQTTISQMQVIISNFRPRGEWNATTDYFKNNLAGLNGKTYIALQNNTNKPVTDTSFWMLFADRGAKGERGEKGEPGTGIKVLGHFNDVSELPSNPTLGDAYTIGADRDLYVYNGNDWQNLGSIKGVEGKSAYEVAVENGFVGTEIEWLETLIGPPGPDGPPGPPADLTEINQKVDDLQTEVTEHLGQIATTEKLGHIKPDGTTISVDPETGVASANLGDPVYQLTDGAYAKNFAGNLNDLVESGLYFIKKGALNLPPNAPVFVDGFLVEVAVAEDASSPTNISVVQTVELYGITDASAKTYKRRGYHHIGLLWRWGDWVEGVSKLQENFVQAVLTAGTQDPTYPISYYKDSLGRVYVEGQARADTAGMIAFVMPVGYRPAIATQVVIPQTTNPTGLKTMTLQANGYFTSIQYTPSSNVSFNFSYRAGA